LGALLECPFPQNYAYDARLANNRLDETDGDDVAEHLATPNYQ